MCVFPLVLQIIVYQIMLPWPSAKVISLGLNIPNVQGARVVSTSSGMAALALVYNGSTYVNYSIVYVNILFSQQY